MRWLLAWTLWMLAPLTASSATIVYVSLAPEQKIVSFRLDEATGKLQPVQTLSVDGAPGSLGVDPARRRLFASLRTTSSLASFQIDPESGKLTQLSTANLPAGENAAFVRTDRSGRWLLSASYAAGKVVVHRIDDSGRIETPSVQTITTAQTAHAVAVTPDNRWAFVPHVAPNAIFQFRLNADTGELTLAGQAPGGKEQAGPRHLALHPRLPLAFSSDEKGSSITSYRLSPDSGLAPLETLSTLPADFTKGNSTAEVKVHPSGRFVWVSNRGHDSLAGFAIDDAGKLSPIEQTPTEKTPRSFEIDPSGRYVFGAGEGSGKLALFRVNLESGKLTRYETLELGKSLTWVLAVELKGK